MCLVSISFWAKESQGSAAWVSFSSPNLFLIIFSTLWNHFCVIYCHDSICQIQWHRIRRCFCTISSFDAVDKSPDISSWVCANLLLSNLLFLCTCYFVVSQGECWWTLERFNRGNKLGSTGWDCVVDAIRNCSKISSLNGFGLYHEVVRGGQQLIVANGLELTLAIARFLPRSADTLVSLDMRFFYLISSWNGHATRQCNSVL